MEHFEGEMGEDGSCALASSSVAWWGEMGGVRAKAESTIQRMLQ